MKNTDKLFQEVERNIILLDTIERAHRAAEAYKTLRSDGLSRWTSLKILRLLVKRTI